MTPSAVTAMGIRDGDHAVLEALVERRGHAVLAFCERACAPGMALEAAGEAFARFRATVMTVDEPAGLDPESTLLSATWHAAAERVPRSVPPPTGPLGRLLGANAAPQLLAVVPALLVARADGTLDAAGEAELTRLLTSSPTARGIEERLSAAEQAYRTAPFRPLEPELVEDLVTAMVSEPVSEPEREDDVIVTANGNPPLFASTVADEPEPETETESEPEPDPDAPEVATEDEAEEQPEDEPEPERVPEDEPAAEVVAAPEATEDEAIADDEPEAGEDVEAHPDDADDVEHVQTASGAVDELLEAPAPTPVETPAPPPASTPLTAAETTRGLPRLPAERPAVPGRGALAPAGAVVTVAAIGAMVAAGVFGGNDPQPAVDTGLVPRSAAIAVPDGQAAAVIDDLRDAAAESRRNRIADERQRAAAAARARREARERDEAEAAAPRAAQPSGENAARGSGAAAPRGEDETPAREREQQPADEAPAEPVPDADGDGAQVPTP